MKTLNVLLCISFVQLILMSLYVGFFVSQDAESQGPLLSSYLGSLLSYLSVLSLSYAMDKNRLISLKQDLKALEKKLKLLEEDQKLIRRERM
ncbi:MAG: hypothetical protein ACFE0I_05645 [Elainellaceae cyanobacterium]